METTLYGQEASEGDYLVIKPVPGQVVAQVDPGPHMQEYARLFAAAPDLLSALEDVVASAQANCSGSLANAITAGQEAIKRAAPVYQYESFEDTINFAESIGWVDTHGDAEEGDWEGDDVDECELEAVEFIRSKGYRVLGYE